MRHKLVRVFEKENVVAKTGDQLAKTLADPEALCIRLGGDLLAHEAGEHFGVGAVDGHGQQGRLRFLRDEGTCVAATLEQDLEQWVKVGLHAAFEEFEHVLDRHQSDL